MSIVDPPRSSSAAALPASGRSDQAGPITLEMYDRMIAAGVFDRADPQPLELIRG